MPEFELIPNPELIPVPFNQALEILDVLRLTPIYALLNSADEGELGEDFKPHKWTGYEKEHAEKARDAYIALLELMTESVKRNDE